ncbi:hypothetical protein DFH06DRAFT_1234997 [Mycena polygramma]|nr:hypothetical protein DFH06DRAFT_1234997 [Mycena polygramma]
MSTELDELDWDDASQFLSPSSEHGSDGELYVPEASQQNEMIRVFRRREKRRRSDSDLSVGATPRPSAFNGQTLTTELFGPGGALDSQTSSQAYVAHMHHDAGQSIHTQSQTYERSSSPIVQPKSEPVHEVISKSEPDAPPSSELEELREQLRQSQGNFLTLLERATTERDEARADARKWRIKAESAVSILQQACNGIGRVIDDLEDGF